MNDLDPHLPWYTQSETDSTRHAHGPRAGLTAGLRVRPGTSAYLSTVWSTPTPSATVLGMKFARARVKF